MCDRVVDKKMAQQTMSPPKFPPGISPGRRTRQQEKEELQHLNDRFVTYIDRVRKLRDEKDRLDSTLEHIQTSSKEETVSVKRIYDRELEDARVLIDDTAKEKARYQILASKNAEKVEALEAELKELNEELERLRPELVDARKNAEDLETQRRSAISDKITTQQKLQEVEEEVEELRIQLKKQMKNLEAEVLSKVDLQNQIQSLREDMAFKKKLYDEELTTVRRTGYSVYRDGSGVEETDDDFAERLQAAIDDAREEIEKETEQYRLDLEKAFRAKLEMLENQTMRDASTITRLNSELRQVNASFSQSNKTITKLQETTELLENSLREKEQELGLIKQRHSDDMSRLMDEMRLLRENYNEKIREYEALLDLRIQLEQEIATLSALLQEEEIRLNISATPTREKRTRQHSEKDGPRLKKQKKQVAATSSSAAGFIQICDVDPDGRFIQLKNMSDKIEPLGGFKIVHEVESTNEKVEFRFHSKSKLQGGASVTVWAAGADEAVHTPPTDIIWKAIRNWGNGPKTLTSLCTKAGEVVATFTQRKEVSFSESSSQLELEQTDSGSRSFPYIPETSPVRVQQQESTTTVQSSSTAPPVTVHRPHPQGDPEGERGCVIS